MQSRRAFISCSLARIILSGKAERNLVMPPLRAVFDDKAIAAVLTFVLASWGNNGAAVAPSTVAEARKATEGREQPCSSAELEELPSRRRKQ